MALEESINELEKIESNGITAYIDPKLREAMKQVGQINIDFVTRPDGSGGYMIKAGQPGDCSDSSGCDGCG